MLVKKKKIPALLKILCIDNTVAHEKPCIRRETKGNSLFAMM